MGELIVPLLLSFPKQPAPSRPLADKQNDEQLRSFSDKLKKFSMRQLAQQIEGEHDILDVSNSCGNVLVETN